MSEYATALFAALDTANKNFLRRLDTLEEILDKGSHAPYGSSHDDFYSTPSRAGKTRTGRLEYES